MTNNHANNRRLRLGIVGGGSGLIGKIHAAGARLSNKWDIVAGALSSNPTKAVELGKSWYFDQERCYRDYKTMAREEAQRENGIDAVAIVTPNYLHAPIAREFMAQGIHIISDKPLTENIDSAFKIYQDYLNSNVVFAVTYSYASHVMVKQAREMIKAGLIGEIRQVHIEYFQDWAVEIDSSNADNIWRLDSAKGGSSFTVLDIGTHAEHLLRYVSGESIDKVRAEYFVTGKPKPMEDTAFINLKLSNGAPGTIMVSQTIAGFNCGLKFRIAGSLATLEWEQENPEYLTVRWQGKPAEVISRGHGCGMMIQTANNIRLPRGHPEALTDAWANLYGEFASAVSNHIAQNNEQLSKSAVNDHLPDIVDGLKGMEFVEACNISAKSGKWLKLDPKT